MIAMAAWARALAEDGAELRERVDQAASLLEAAGNRWQLADVFQKAADLAQRSGHDREATEFLDRAVPIMDELDDPWLWLQMRPKLGWASLLNGNPDRASQAFREQLNLCRELAVPPEASQGLTGLAAVAAVHDDLSRAARLSGAAVAHRVGTPHDDMDARLDATFFQPARTRLGGTAWNAALREGAALGLDAAIAYALDESRHQAGNLG
jgi:non-specific serine/threonine protein kinase